MCRFHKVLLNVLLVCVWVFDLKAQQVGEEVARKNSVGIRGFIIPAKKPFYYVNPTFRRHFNIISIEAGLFYASDVVHTNRISYSGLSVGYIVKPFKRTGRFEPLFENRLLLLGGFEKDGLPNWRAGGVLEIGTGIDYRVNRFRVGAGFGMGVGYFHSDNSEFVDLISVWMLPSLSVFYSFK